MPNKLSQFWQELKRRNVVRVITVYAGAAFVLLELVDMITEPFGLPDWTFKLATIILSIGFVVAIILSWIYDIHPEGGIVKTESAHKAKPENKAGTTNSWKIASYISFAVILGLIAFNILGGKRKSRIDESLAKSIAVLPFNNLSGDVNQAYICDGITDEIISNLYKVNSFDKVVSYTSVQSFKDPNRNITEIAEVLGVNYILEGSYKKMGDNFRITAQLIEPKSDNHIWLKDYDLPYDEVMGIPGEIGLQIARNINVFLSEEEQERVERIPTSDIDAYDLYLKGIQVYYDYWSTGNLNYVHQSIEYYLNAIELDPEFSLAYTGLGRAYWMLGAFDPNRRPFHYAESKRLIKKAISLDPGNGWAYAELGVVLNDWDWDSTASRIAIERALQLSPNRSDVYDHYVHLAARMKDCDKLAVLLSEYKKRFNPEVDLGLSYFYLKLLTCQEDYEEIARIADREWDRNTNVLNTYYIADAYLITGNYEKALEVAYFITETFSIRELGISYKGIILGLMGNIEGARGALNELEILSESREISKGLFAGISLALGDVEKTREYLGKALEDRDAILHEIEHMAPFYLHKNESWLKDIIDRSWIPLEDSDLQLDLGD